MKNKNSPIEKTKLRDMYPFSAIVSELRRGESFAISAGDLSNRIGVENTRSLRLMIEQLRSSGECILSSERGYFLPDSKEEAKRWQNHMFGVMKKYAALAKSADPYLKS